MISQSANDAIDVWLSSNRFHSEAICLLIELGFQASDESIPPSEH